MNGFVKAMVVVALIGPSAAEAADDLVHLEVLDQRAENGKVLDMRVDEIERGPEASIVEVRFTSGGSVSSSMFVMKAMCRVAESRQASYFLTEPVGGTPTRYRVTFPKDATGPTIDVPATGPRPARTMPAAIPVAQCRLVGF